MYYNKVTIKKEGSLHPLMYTDGTAKLDLELKEFKNRKIDHSLKLGGLFFSVFQSNEN